MTLSLGEGRARRGPTSPGQARSSGSGARAAAAWARLDRVGLVVAAIAAVALTLEPFATFRANRIVSGKGVDIVHALPDLAAECCVPVLSLAILGAIFRAPSLARLLLAAAALAVLAVTIGLVPAHLTPPGNAIARTAPASGFWLISFAFAILAADAIAKAALGPLARLAALAAAGVLVGLVLGSGWWNGLSVMKEYASHADTFWREGGKHIELAFGSLAGAVAVGLPLGLACHRSSALRGATLPVLNVVQTIPSIAMYGLMMVPLGVLAARIPLLGEFGIRGIGTAPAVIALFLYSLLPVVANMVIGLEQVPQALVEAAKGMGMTQRQRLSRIELPLAAPIILTGIRIVLVQNIGLVTIAALIGGGGFGSFVFQGIGQAAIDLVLLGAVPTIALAFVAATILDCVIDLIRRVPS